MTSAPAGPSGAGSRRPVVTALLGLSALLYASWVLGPLLNPGVDPLAAYASELAARDQPYHLVFGLADLATGLLVVGAALLVPHGARSSWRGLFRSGWVRAGWPGAVVFGVATAFDGTGLSMDCAPSRDDRCARLERLHELSWRHDAHLFTSSVAVIGAVFSLFALLVVARRHAVTRWYRCGLAVTLVFGVATVGTCVEAFAPDRWLGLWQRVQLVGLSGWLGYAAVLTAVGVATGVPAVRSVAVPR